MKNRKPSDTVPNKKNGSNELQARLAQRKKDFERLIQDLDHSNTVEAIRALRKFIDASSANNNHDDSQKMDVDDK